MKYTATLSAVQVGQAVKSLLLLGERKITIEETEKGPFRRHHNNRNGPFKKVYEQYITKRSEKQWLN